MKNIPITKIKPNPNNPRTFHEDKLEQLSKSIESFPEMMELRPIIVDESMMILGGNFRYQALKHIGRTEIPENWIVQASKLTEDQKAEFIVKDNVGFGNWDWDLLANQWDSELLIEWGLDVWKTEDIDIDEFFEDNDAEQEDVKNKIVLEYSASDFELINEKFNSMDGSKENIVWGLLFNEGN